MNESIYSMLRTKQKKVRCDSTMDHLVPQTKHVVNLFSVDGLLIYIITHATTGYCILWCPSYTPHTNQ
jgi:hypothetical protein